MKKLGLIAVASLLSTGTYAADFAPIVDTIDYAPIVYDWSGFYIGVNAGYGGGTFEHPFEITDGVDTIDGSIDVTAGGFLGGVQAGFNYQLDSNFLIGIEADIQGSTIDGRVSLEVTDGTGVILNPGETFEADAGTRLDWFGTLRGRVGFVQDQFVLYATGGLAYGSATSSIFAGVSGGPTLIDESETTDGRIGWTVGAGLEYALMENITFKTEYLYTDLGTENLISADLGQATATLDSTVAFHAVRAGLNFQF